MLNCDSAPFAEEARSMSEGTSVGPDPEPPGTEQPRFTFTPPHIIGHFSSGTPIFSSTPIFWSETEEVPPGEEGQPQFGFAETGLDAPDILALLSQVDKQMGAANMPDALRRSLRTILALYDAKANGGEPVVRFRRGRAEQAVNLPGPAS
jgi:hypothetical protein